MFAADAGNTGEVCEGDPFGDVAQVNLEVASELDLMVTSASEFEQGEGGLDAAIAQKLKIVWGKSGEISDRPVRGGNALRL